MTQGGALLGVTLVTLGLFVWANAEVWAQQADRVSAAAWAVRCFAIAIIAAAQVLFVLLVTPSFFGRARRGPFEQAYALATGLVAVLSLVSAGSLAAAAGW